MHQHPWHQTAEDVSFLREVERRALEIQGPIDLAPLIDRIKDAKIVMLGESTHGTHEFYDLRRMITEWLIVKHGFTAIAVEGEWPPCSQVDRFIQGTSDETNPREVLESFARWPTWMWANTDVLRMIEWLRQYNDRQTSEKKVGFYGLDVYSLFESMDTVVTELEKINLFYAKLARKRYSCFASHHRDEVAYARSLLSIPEGCEHEVLEVLKSLLELRTTESAALFNAQQNARIVRNAENYYRSMIHGNDDSWNIRDHHMLETLDTLLAHHGSGARVIVWAHNTHIGDYRATDMGKRDLVNLGGLARSRYGSGSVALVGFGTHEGKLTASHAWDGPIETLHIPRARAGTLDALLHQAAQTRSMERFALIFDPHEPVEALIQTRGQRAIGVVYNPADDHLSNYVPTRLAQRYDAFVFVDQTNELQPMIQSSRKDKLPETWPVGI